MPTLTTFTVLILIAHYAYSDVDSVAKETLPTRAPKPRHGVDFLGPLWLSRTYKITCCRRGTPIAENPKLVSNWTETALDYAVDESVVGTNRDDHCRVFQGTFLLSAAALYNSSFMGYGVQCKCPESDQQLDQHCRQLPPCQNEGYRSQSMGRRCSCPQPYFGEFCEKVCDQGQVLVGIDGHSYCSCLPFYQGETCEDLVCLNGGFEMRGRCSCPHNFLGYHCEIDTNRTRSNSRFQRYGQQNNENGELFSRDISGTVFSLVMIIVLVVSMYLLMKHRMQVQSQFANSRREEINRAAAIYGAERGGGGTTISRDDMRILPFVSAGIQPPPPYQPARTRRVPENLPPLPSYEDATKDTIITSTSAGIEMQPRTSPTTEGSNREGHAENDHNTPSGSSPPPPFLESETPTIHRNVSTRRSL
ncbi:unnamed protein product [Caenorhabditis bovis]|uniref:EGF-like domain-containing protein n=1 Tax=Caenorhabditis bovis TaxID=2654633 RepID=A0A8S1ECP8_9PELO|nr:unnamed protein product [Caenorhabditis bovis]